MLTLIERHWPKLALLLTLDMGLLLLALRHWRNYRAGKLSRLDMMRNIFVETASLLLVFALARLAGGHVAEFVDVGYGPSTSSGVTWLLGLLSALLVGAAAGPSTNSGQVSLSTRRWGGG